MRQFFIIFLNLFLVSCASLKESPVIYFSNASSQPITEINCVWVEKNVLTLPELTPGSSRSQSFYIKGASDFFGSVIISWYNADGVKNVKEFNLTKGNLPSFSDATFYSYVQLYFDQEDVEVVTSDVADLSGKTRRMERILVQYSDQYKQSHGAVQTSLISLQPKKDSSLPSWLSNSY